MTAEALPPSHDPQLRGDALSFRERPLLAVKRLTPLFSFPVTFRPPRIVAGSHFAIE